MVTDFGLMLCIASACLIGGILANVARTGARAILLDASVVGGGVGVGVGVGAAAGVGVFGGVVGAIANMIEPRNRFGAGALVTVASSSETSSISCGRTRRDGFAFAAVGAASLAGGTTIFFDGGTTTAGCGG